MMFPTKRFVAIMLFPVLVCIPLLFIFKFDEIQNLQNQVYFSFLFFNIFFFALFLFDAITIPSKGTLRAMRRLDVIFSIDFFHKVGMCIEFRSYFRRKVKVFLREDISEIMEIIEFPKEGKIKKGANIFNYKLRIKERGHYELKFIYVTCFSILGFARRVHKVCCYNEIRVYPDLKTISKYAILARRSHLGLVGVRKMRRSGGDNDFEMLKDYTRDDEFRHIDWKATARSGTLMARSYQKTQNQNIIFLLDCGRMMTSEYKNKSLLDYTLSSMLLLSWVALAEGDRVGLLAFNNKIIRYIRPQSGRRHHRKLIQAGYNLKAQHVETNFDLAFGYLGTVFRQRSLLCLLTNIIDEMNAGQLESYLGTLAGRHLPFAVSLKQPELELIIDSNPAATEDMYIQAGVADFLMWKEEVMQKLKNKSVLVLEALPDDLNANLINEYLRIKARNLL